jgi:dTMP kinase
VHELIVPALGKGLVVVCDRFVDSSEVYQGRARGLGWGAIRQINRWICRPIWPDLTLVLDLDPTIGLERVLERQGRLGLLPDRLESEGHAFHVAVRQGFLVQAAEEPERIKVVDAMGSQAVVSEAIWTHIKPLLEVRGLLAS